MKKLITLIAGIGMVLALSMNTQAQSVANVLKSTPAHVATDTVINTAVKYQIATLNGYANTATFQSVITKISGTVAGSIALQGSLDGVNYVTIGTPVTPTDLAVQSVVFPGALSTSNFIYYRIAYTGAGTMSVKLNSYWIARKQS